MKSNKIVDNMKYWFVVKIENIDNDEIIEIVFILKSEFEFIGSFVVFLVNLAEFCKIIDIFRNEVLFYILKNFD